MKIDQNANNIKRAQNENARPVERRADSADQQIRSDRLGGKDAATLSERARLLARARTAMDNTPDVRAERVSALQEQISSGAYQVPVEALAKRLISRLNLDI